MAFSIFIVPGFPVFFPRRCVRDRASVISTHTYTHLWQLTLVLYLGRCCIFVLVSIKELLGVHVIEVGKKRVRFGNMKGMGEHERLKERKKWGARGRMLSFESGEMPLSP